MYHIDLVGMTQTNLSSRKMRQIRRCDPYVSFPGPSMPTPAHAPRLCRWKFRTGHGWSDCLGDIQQALEAAYESGESRVVTDAGYEFDLQSVTQRNVLTGRRRELRRLPE